MKYYFKKSVFIFGLLFASSVMILIQYLYGDSGRGLSCHSIGSDDAYISFRYAKNLFDGFGLTFNADSRVEGYSNFLYTLMMLPALYFGIEAVYEWSVVLNTFFFLSTICLIYLSFKRHNIVDRYTWSAIVLVALNPWIIVNVPTGLESIFILLISIAFLFLLFGERTNNYFYGLCLLTVILVLSRVDGFLLPLMGIFYLACSKQFKKSAFLFLWLFGVFALYTMFRYYYYDDFVANTFYNKVSGDTLIRVVRGAKDFYEQLYRTGYLYPLIFLTLLNLWAGYKKCDKRVVLSPFNFYIYVWMIYYIYVGGDIYFERFLLVILAAIPIQIFLLLKSLAMPRLALVALVSIFVLQTYHVKKEDRFKLRDKDYDVWISVGKFLKENYSDKVLAVDAAGKIPYYSGMQTIDMYGLNDKYIGKSKSVAAPNSLPGHTKYDSHYVLSREPDVIAAWINHDFDLNCGVKRSLYKDSYILKYLVNPTRTNKGKKNIIDVSAYTDEELGSIVEQYSYAILIKKPNK
jgi:arabinofuranosyltransferase